MTDDELKAAYNDYKENFYSPAETRDLKLIDVNVTASASTRLCLPPRQLAHTVRVTCAGRTGYTCLAYDRRM